MFILFSCLPIFLQYLKTIVSSDPKKTSRKDYLKNLITIIYGSSSETNVTLPSGVFLTEFSDFRFTGESFSFTELSFWISDGTKKRIKKTNILMLLFLYDGLNNKDKINKLHETEFKQ